MPIQEESGGFDHGATQSAPQNRRKTDRRKVVPYEEWTPQQKQALRDSKGIKQLTPQPGFPSAKTLNAAEAGNGRNVIDSPDFGAALVGSAGNITEEGAGTDQEYAMRKKVVDEMPWYQRILPQIGSGFMEDVQGLKQTDADMGESLFRATGGRLFKGYDPALGRAAEAQKQTNEKRAMDAPLNEGFWGHLFSGLGQAAPTAAIPVGAGTSILGSLGRGALTGAGIGALGTVGENESRLGNTATSAGGGILGAGLSKVGGKAVDAGGALVNKARGQTVEKQLGAEYDRLLKNRNIQVTPEFQGDLYKAVKEANQFIPDFRPPSERWSKQLLDQAAEKDYVVNAQQFKRNLSPIKKEIAKTIADKDVARVAAMVPNAGENMIKSSMSPQEVADYMRTQDLWKRMRGAQSGLAQTGMEKATAAGASALGAMLGGPLGAGAGALSTSIVPKLLKRGALAMAVRKPTPFEKAFGNPTTNMSAATAAALMPELFSEYYK
jgi:hypothetical protein